MPPRRANGKIALCKKQASSPFVKGPTTNPFSSLAGQVNDSGVTSRTSRGFTAATKSLVRHGSPAHVATTVTDPAMPPFADFAS